MLSWRKGFFPSSKSLNVKINIRVWPSIVGSSEDLRVFSSRSMIVDILARSVPYILCAGKNPIWSWKACWRGTPPLSSFFRAPWWMPLIWPGSRYIKQNKNQQTNKQNKIPLSPSRKQNQNQWGDKHRESPALLNITYTNLHFLWMLLYLLTAYLYNFPLYILSIPVKRGLFLPSSHYLEPHFVVCASCCVPYTCETKGGTGERAKSSRQENLQTKKKMNREISTISRSPAGATTKCLIHRRCTMSLN